MDLISGHGRPFVALGVAVVAVLAAAPLPGVSFKAPPALTRGQATTVRLRLTGGRRGSRRAVLTVALSANGRLDKHDQVLLTRSLGKLRARRSRSVTARLAATARTPLGTRRLLACVAASRHAKAHCLSRPVRILAPAAPKPVAVPVTAPAAAPAPAPIPTATPTPAPTPTPHDAPPIGDGHFPASVPTTLPGVVPDPQTVEAHPDAARSASGTITSDGGGTLTATGADGTAYTLEVPPKAVLSDVDVTMTPLSSIGDLPFAHGLSGGVQFAPEGLQLLQPAALTITPATAPTGTPVAFGYHGTGTDLGLAPVHAESGGAYAIDVLHFSGDGLAGATDGEIAAALEHAPSQTKDQYRAQIASDLLHAIDIPTLLAHADAYFDAIIKPELDAALHDDSLIPAAVADALQLARMLELLGQDFGDRGRLIYDDLLTFMVNEYNHAYERCVAERAPIETRNMLAAARMLQLQGAYDRIDSGKLFGCLSFKLDLDLQGHGTTGDPSRPLLDGSLHGHATQLPLEFDLGLNRITGQFPIAVDSYSWFDYLCNRTGGTATPGDPGLFQLFIRPNLVEAVDATGRLASFGPPTIDLRITPGTLTTTNACGLTGFSGTFYRNLWNLSFADRRAPNDTTVMFRDEWSFAGGDPWATLDVTDTQHPASSETWTATLRLVLHHTPHGS